MKKPIKIAIIVAALAAAAFPLGRPVAVFAQSAVGAPAAHPLSVRAETLLQTDSSWDGARYESYPSGQPQLSVLKITIPPRTALPWHSHAMPNVAYVLSGELRVETRDGKAKRLTKGDVLPETVGTVHRGVTGDKGVVLIVFYAGVKDLPLSEIAK